VVGIAVVLALLACWRSPVRRGMATAGLVLGNVAIVVAVANSVFGALLFSGQL